MATETRAEGAHPPVTVWGGVGKGGFENEKEGGAAEVAVFAQYGFAPASVMRRNPESLVQSQKDIAPAGMENPAVDIAAGEISARKDIVEDGFGVFRCESRDLRSEHVAEHARFLFETEEIAIFWREE